MAKNRRLINKKAYEELLLLDNFLFNYDLKEKMYSCGLRIGRENEEEFFIRFEYISNESQQLVSDELKGKNYTEISKKLMEYLNER